MKVAVLGAGNGGCATAFDFALHGHEVTLWAPEEFPGAVPDLIEADNLLESTGDLTGSVRLSYVGHDMDQALARAEYVFAVGPAYATGPFAEAAAPYLRPEQVVVVSPSSCGGALAFAHAAGLSLPAPAPVVAELHTLPYAVRLVGPTTLHVYLKLQHALYLASLPKDAAPDIVSALRDVYPALEPADSVFQTTLQNGNPVIHPAVTLLNAGLLERTEGDFLFYEEGVTPGVGRLIQAVDEERLAIGAALGVQLLSEPEIGVRQGYMREATYDIGYSTAPGFTGIKAQSSLDHRYLDEDVGFSLLFLIELAQRLGVPVPTMDAVVQVASVVRGLDYRAQPHRTLAELGVGDYSAEQLRAL